MKISYREDSYGKIIEGSKDGWAYAYVYASLWNPQAQQTKEQAEKQLHAIYEKWKKGL